MKNKKDNAVDGKGPRRAPFLKKIRLDQALLGRGLVVEAKEAIALIMAGEVRVNGQVQTKAFSSVSAGDDIAIQRKHPYVSRGALKLAKAIDAFAIRVADLKILDLGISTGGFSDYLLKCGAAAVCGVDVNISQVDYGLRQNPRLQLLKKNARFLRKEDIPFTPDLIIMDLSFISVTLVLPVLHVFADAKILVLVKPQFEAARGQVGPGGVIRDPETRRNIVLELKKQVENMDFAVRGFTLAGVKGRRGNQEYFFLLESGKNKSIDDTIITDAAGI
ncbi:MAG: TlyA family RNA methyltransferase [Candidatus Aminicenantes bacterium]|nr:TlyA family RNA methyltransferase [Candidatus Aminicenantes bacterium]